MSLIIHEQGDRRRYELADLYFTGYLKSWSTVSDIQSGGVSANIRIDPVFQATQELGYNEKEIAQAESKIKVYEQELALLVDTMSKEGVILRRSACAERARYVGENMINAERKLERLEKKNRELKKALSIIT